MTIRMCTRILTWRDCEGYVFRVWDLGRTLLDLYVFLGLGLDLDLVSGSVSLLGFRSFPIFHSLFFPLSTGCLGLGGFRAFICFLFSSALSNWFVHFVWNALGQRGSVGTGFGPVAFVAFGLRLGHEAGGLRPPLASPAPTSLACPHAEE